MVNKIQRGDKTVMNCSDIKAGSYDCSYNITLPYLCKFPWEDDSKLQSKTVPIDKCLLSEILQLWEQGIKTTGCCCGHGNTNMAYIGVIFEDINRMKSMGYTVALNPCRPNDEDSFYPKTV